MVAVPTCHGTGCGSDLPWHWQLEFRAEVRPRPPRRRGCTGGLTTEVRGRCGRPAGMPGPLTRTRTPGVLAKSQRQSRSLHHDDGPVFKSRLLRPGRDRHWHGDAELKFKSEPPPPGRDWQPAAAQTSPAAALHWKFQGRSDVPWHWLGLVTRDAVTLSLNISPRARAVTGNLQTVTNLPVRRSPGRGRG